MRSGRRRQGATLSVGGSLLETSKLTVGLILSLPFRCDQLAEVLSIKWVRDVGPTLLGGFVTLMIPQVLADQLIAMGKIPEDPLAVYAFPQKGEKLVIPLVSDDHREEFKLDVNRAGRIHVQLRVTHQLRGRQIVQLVRLDVGGPDHANPDGQIITCPHLHIYREGFGDKWAQPVPTEFSDLTNIAAIFKDFATFCKVLRLPTVNFPLI